MKLSELEAAMKTIAYWVEYSNKELVKREEEIRNLEGGIKGYKVEVKELKDKIRNMTAVLEKK